MDPRGPRGEQLDGADAHPDPGLANPVDGPDHDRHRADRQREDRSLPHPRHHSHARPASAHSGRSRPLRAGALAHARAGRPDQRGGREVAEALQQEQPLGRLALGLLLRRRQEVRAVAKVHFRRLAHRCGDTWATDGFLPRREGVAEEGDVLVFGRGRPDARHGLPRRHGGDQRGRPARAPDRFLLCDMAEGGPVLGPDVVQGDARDDPSRERRRSRGRRRRRGLARERGHYAAGYRRRLPRGEETVGEAGRGEAADVGPAHQGRNGSGRLEDDHLREPEELR
mmetsp:Transcript_79049/g.226628  ORF Transcript_79049/g.226628 Transcript_79049/m.226628 type:complete len:283 (+) Transcript_79049:279-1127(+)